MNLLFILDPLEQLKAEKDTSLAMMREASKRGHTLYIAMQHGLYLRGELPHVQAQTFTFNSDASKTYILGELVDYALYDFALQHEKLNGFLQTHFGAIIMRKDPPFDNEYLYSTYLLEIASNHGVKVFNNPSAIRGWNEKLSVTRFPQFSPECLVTANNDLIREFLKAHLDIVVKPLDGMGGSSIFRLTLSDPNISVILETITEFGKRTVMTQKYLPQILQGDKRIILIDGEPLPYSLARIPKAGETRGNLAAGGTGVAQLLSERDLEIAKTVGKVLKQEGLFLVGLDVIGESLTEINVTSPTGMVEIANQTKDLTQPCNPAAVMLDALEKACVKK